MSKIPRLSLALLVLFVLSGFAGLIYQSVWSHYLGLTLGHAAYAQTLVLAIFMGGMAVGAWLASQYAVRWRQLILGYAIVEAVIGVMGLVFHPLFVGYTEVSQASVLPALSSPALAHGYQWLTAALLIAPQSILLGATFPLMSAGLIRVLPDQQGEVLGGLYFSNSLGAAVGALAATFLLLPLLGLPGTVRIAGLLNLMVAAGAVLLARRLDEAAPGQLPGAPAMAAPAVTGPEVVDTKEVPAPAGSIPTSASAPASTSADPAETLPEIARLARILLWSTAISGAASFVYEIGWVRLLNQALGSTIHSFELMLAAFILGLAFGGLWIRKRARSIAAPVRYVGYVQVWMALAALLSVPVFTQSFHWVGWIMGALSRSSDGYTLYELATAGISLLVMFPAAFLAGMTLPLFTLALLRAGAGERAIGRIYAANTLGAIVGVAVAMHVLIPLVGVRMAVTLAAFVDGLVGLYLLWVVAPARVGRPLRLVAATLCAALVFSVVLGKPDPMQQISGVFRTGEATVDGARVSYLRDGKTATIARFRYNGSETIATNGKPDASLKPMTERPTPDEITMIMAGSLPLVLHPKPDDIAVIGWGSGLTTHTLMGSRLPKAVDTIEIERAMVDGARGFGTRVARAYEDPRSHVRIDDARTFFSTGARRYDAIISEPSNPWVSGVAALFTQEFYAFLKRHLNEGGMLVQWLHMYEINDPLVATMLAAVEAEFPHADLYVTNTSDVLIVASMTPTRLPAQGAMPTEPALLAELRRVGLGSLDHFTLRRIGGVAALRGFIRQQHALPHSDYYPTVSLYAPRTRFMGSKSEALVHLVGNGLPVLDILECRAPLGADAVLANSQLSLFWELHARAVALSEAGARGQVTDAVRAAMPGTDDDLRALLQLSNEIMARPDLVPAWSAAVAEYARSTLSFLPPSDLVQAWDAPTWLPEGARGLPAVAPVMAAYSAAARRDPAAMRRTAEAVLAMPPGAHAPVLREQMVVLAMLGALGSGDAAAVAVMDERWAGGKDPRAQAIRGYLLAWASADAPVCRAPRAAAVR